MTDERRERIVREHRERLIRVLPKIAIRRIVRDIGGPSAVAAPDARYYLLKHWNEQVRLILLDLITRNLEP